MNVADPFPFSRRQALAGLAAGMITAACGRKASGERLHARLAIGGQTQLIYLPATMAQELGYLGEERLEITYQDFPGGAKALEALVGGSTDVVCGFYDHTIQMAAQGRKLRAFLSIMRYPGLVAVALAPEIRRMEDLKGKTVGVSSPGSSTHMFLNYLLMTHGIKPEDVSPVAIGMSSTALAAVLRGKVDAAIMTDPALQVVRAQKPGLVILGDTHNAEGVREAFGVDVYPASVLYSSEEWLAAHREEASRLGRAVKRAMDWMRTHSPEEVRARMPEGFRTSDPAADIEGLRNTQAMLSPDGQMTAEGAGAVLKVLSASLESVRRAQIDLSATFTNDLVPR
jgi:NitT/TauT family transport system substrate-binding protein